MDQTICLGDWLDCFKIDAPCSVIHSRTVVILWRATSSEVKILSLKTRWFRVIHNCQHIQGRILTETPDGGRQMVFREASRAAAKFCWTARWTVFLRGRISQTLFTKRQRKKICITDSVSLHLGQARSLLKPLLWRFSPRGIRSLKNWLGNTFNFSEVWVDQTSLYQSRELLECGGWLTVMADWYPDLTE